MKLQIAIHEFWCFSTSLGCVQTFCVLQNFKSAILKLVLRIDIFQGSDLNNFLFQRIVIQTILWNMILLKFTSSWENFEIRINNVQDVSVESVESIVGKIDSEVMHTWTSDMTKNNVRDWCLNRIPWGNSNFDVLLKRLIFPQRKWILKCLWGSKNFYIENWQVRPVVHCSISSHSKVHYYFKFFDKQMFILVFFDMI